MRCNEQSAQLRGALVDELVARVARAELGEQERPTCPSCGGRLRPSGWRSHTALTQLGQWVLLERTS
jgi:hypothetical protein